MGADDLIRESIEIPSQTKELSRVREFVGSIVARSRLEEVDRNRVTLAVDEAVTNIIEHAYEGIDEGVINVLMEIHEDKVRVVVRDSGTTFDPNSVADPDIEEHVTKGTKGGLGLFLIRQIMDEVSYVFKAGVENELTMVKYIQESS